MQRLLPYETLERAAAILNQTCLKKRIESRFSTIDFLAWAINGEINLTVELPADFLVARKNTETFGDTPLRPRFPAGTFHCFIGRQLAFALSRKNQAELDVVYVISNSSAKDIYYSVKPYMTITVSDLCISDDQLIRLINALGVSNAKKSECDGGLPTIVRPEESQDDEAREDDYQIESDTKLPRREQQIRRIEQMADECGYSRLKIPDGGKSDLMKKCKSKWPELFGAGHDPFEDAWKQARKEHRLRMENHDKFSRR